MADIGFSWSDSVRAAVSSCLPCLTSSDTNHDPADSQRPRNALLHTMPPPRARPDELEGLLADSDSADAETLSLHSHLGDERRHRKRRRSHKGIRLFGWDLFGRPPIYLDSDDEDGAARARTISSSTLDSDAAPLDASTIDELSTARLAAATAAAEEEHRRAKEERRRLRRERKELKRVALAMGLGARPEGDDDEFEGFPGSGPASVSMLRAAVGSASGSGSMSPSVDEFGPFADGRAHAPLDDADVDGADFGAETYARRVPRGASSGTGSDSHSHSRTDSQLDPAAYNHHYLSQQPAPAEPQRKKKRKSAKGRSQSSKQSESSHEPSLLSSHSPSITSPPPDSVGFLEPDIVFADDQFEGFPGGGLEAAHAEEQELVAKVNEPGAEGGFPSAGLRGFQRRKSDMGVFLARRGDD
ncbi:hypothetical protein B0H21DRAFT_292025 [Amylocystis lapponica]|nr:hypothetical protein B0H21DRAFT_292025 [Amylocystis lapponica]